MQIKPIYFITLLVLMGLLHLFANFIGLYEQKIIWIDKVLHIMAGVGAAKLWIWLLQTRFKISLDSIHRAISVSSILGFVLCAAVLWEVFEFAFWTAVPTYALAFNLYSPTVFDVLSDIMTNLIGAILFIVFINS